MAISPQLVGAGLSLAGGLFGGGGPSFRPMNVSGPLGSFSYGRGGMRMGLQPQAQEMMDRLFGGAALGLESLSDPSQVAQDYFGRGMELLAPTQERARTALENRLFAQGRLGATGGQQQFGELMGAQERARTGLAQESLFRGLQARGQQQQQAMQLFGGGMQLGQLPMEMARLGLAGGQGRLQADMMRPADPFATALIGAGSAIGGMPGLFGSDGGGGYVPSDDIFGLDF